MSSPTTTVALLTPRGRGAVATLLVRGDLGLLTERQLFRAANGKPIKEQSLGRIVFGHWIGGEGTSESEEIVLCRRALDEIEIHCHGGSAPAARIVGDLEAAGCRVQTWQEMTTDREGRFAAESLAALASAPTLRTASILARQVNGVFSRAIKRLLAISFNDPTDFELAQSQIDELLSWSDFGRHLTRPWQVVLTGRPNVGKSSLINALLGFTRSIVYDEPGTTRDIVTAETAFDGWPVELADTAGLRQAAVGLEAAGIALAHERLATADCRVLLLDHSTPLTPEDQSLLRQWPDAIVVAHKSDLPCAWQHPEEIPAKRIAVSSHSGTGLDVLIRAITHHLVPQIPTAETAIPFTESQIDLLVQARAATTCDSGLESPPPLRRWLAGFCPTFQAG